MNEEIKKLDKKYSLKQLKTNFKKYGTKYTYVSLEYLNDLIELILEELNNIIEVEKIKKFISIKGIEIKEIDSKYKKRLGIKIEISKIRSIAIIPLEEGLEAFICIEDDKIKVMDNSVILNYESMIKEVVWYIDIANQYGYFNEYDENSTNYLEALKTYDIFYTHSFSRKDDNIRALDIMRTVDAEILLEKIDINKVDNITASNIYYLKGVIESNKNRLLALRNFDLREIYHEKAIEYNPNNINILLTRVINPSFGKQMSLFLRYNDKDLKKCYKYVEELDRAITILDYYYIDNEIIKLIDDNAIKFFEKIVTEKDSEEYCSRFLDVYKKLLNKMIDNNEIEEKISRVEKIINKLEERKVKEIKIKKINAMSINKYKSLSDALYFNEEYRDAIKYYNIVLENIDNKDGLYSYSQNKCCKDISNKKLSKTIKKEIYKKIVNSYIKLSDIENAEKQFEKFKDEFGSDRMINSLEKILNN